MKIIVNRGFDKALTRIVVYKNGQKAAVSTMEGDCCEVSAKEGDKILVKLGFLDTSMLTIASFACHGEHEIYYVSPTAMYRRWEVANYKLLPSFCALFFLLKIGLRSDTLEWLFVGMIFLTVLSLISLQLCSLIPVVRKRMFQIE